MPFCVGLIAKKMGFNGDGRVPFLARGITAVSMRAERRITHLWAGRTTAKRERARLLVEVVFAEDLAGEAVQLGVALPRVGGEAGLELA